MMNTAKISLGFWRWSKESDDNLSNDPGGQLF
jgi:hypothetical protein